MMMQEEHIKIFFENFFAGLNTEEEHQQFIEWLRTAPIGEVKAILEEYNNNFAGDYSPAGEVDLNLVSKIEKALDQYELSKEIRHVEIKKKSWHFFLKIVAAASLVTFISGLAVYFALRTTKDNTPAEVLSQQVKIEVVPGGNKAVLTLSNGSTIVLDDAKNGKIAQQGGTQIAKLANGQIVYNTVDDKPAEVVFNTLTTPRGGQFKLTLPDGSEVWLNAASSIKYPTAFNGNERNVEISGEAYFEIVPNVAKPFKVSVNGMMIKVLGTHFNINAYDDEASVKTTLLEGSVSLTNADATATLMPGQQAQVRNGSDIKVINEVDVDEVVAWKNGYFSFNRVGLQTIMRQIARWYDVEVSYEGEIPKRQFGGKIDRNSNLSEVLKILEESRVHFIIDEKKIIVSP